MHSLLCQYGSIDPSKEWQRSIVTFNSSAPTGESVLVDTKSDSSRKAKIETILHFDGLSPAPTLCSSPGVSSIGFDRGDVLLLAQFTTSTSYDIPGSQAVWSHEALQLAVQVHLFLLDFDLTDGYRRIIFSCTPC